MSQANTMCGIYPALEPRLMKKGTRRWGDELGRQRREREVVGSWRTKQASHGEQRRRTMANKEGKLRTPLISHGESVSHMP